MRGREWCSSSMLCHNSFFENSPELLMSLELGGAKDERNETKQCFLFECFYEKSIGFVNGSYG